MTNLAFPPQLALVDEDEMLGQEITLLAGQINAAVATARRAGFSDAYAR